MSRLLVSTLTLCTFVASESAPAQAGPDETTSRLMNEYVSLLDFGILRLQMRLDGLTTIPSTYVTFDWENNVILVSSYSVDSEWPRDRVEQACTDWFTSIRQNAGINAGTGKLYGVFTYSLFSGLFTHHGYSNTISGKSTEEAAKALDQKYRLQFTWNSYSTTPGEVETLTCSGPLIDKGYSIKIETVPAKATSP